MGLTYIHCHERNKQLGKPAGCCREHSAAALQMHGAGGGRAAQEGGDVCIHIVESLHCTAETNTTLSLNSTAIIKYI